MKIKLLDKKNVYFIEFRTPSNRQLAQIDGPDIEGQTTPEQVYIDRELEKLRKILNTGYAYKILD